MTEPKNKWRKLTDSLFIILLIMLIIYFLIYKDNISKNIPFAFGFWIILWISIGFYVIKTKMLPWLKSNYREILNGICITALITSSILLCEYKDKIYGNNVFTVQFWGIFLFSIPVLAIGFLRFIDWPPFANKSTDKRRFLDPITSIIVGTMAIFGIAFTLLYGTVYSYAISEKETSGLTTAIQKQGIVLLIFVILFSINLISSSIMPFLSNYEGESLEKIRKFFRNLKNEKNKRKFIHRKNVGSALIVSGLIILSIWTPKFIFPNYLSEPYHPVTQTSFYKSTLMKNVSQPICYWSSKYESRYITNIFFNSLSLDYAKVLLSIRNETNNTSIPLFSFNAINWSWSWSSNSLSAIRLNESQSLYATILNKSGNDTNYIISFTVFGYDK